MNSLSATDYQSDGSHASTVVPALGFLIIHSIKNDTLQGLIDNPMGKDDDEQKAALNAIQIAWLNQNSAYILQSNNGKLPTGVTDDDVKSFGDDYDSMVKSTTFEEKKAVILNSEHCYVFIQDKACQVKIPRHVVDPRNGVVDDTFLKDILEVAVINGNDNGHYAWKTNIPKCQACYKKWVLGGSGTNKDCPHDKGDKWYQLPKVVFKPPSTATPTTWYSWIKEVLQWMFMWIKAPLSWASLPKFPQRPNFPGIPTCLDNKIPTCLKNNMSAIIGLLVSIAAGLFAYRNKSHTATKKKPVPAGWMSSIICFIIAMVIAFVIASAWMGEALD